MWGLVRGPHKNTEGQDPEALIHREEAIAKYAGEEFMTRHFLSLFDFTKEEAEDLLKQALLLKIDFKKGKIHQPLQGKILGMIFEKTSTRTRVSFEVAMLQLGGHAIYLTSQTSQLGRGETYEDTARVLSRYVQGIVMRTFEQTKLERLAKFSSVPVINALSDLLHPCQILADLLTLIEERGSLERLKVAWVGDGNNVANSWIEAACLFGFDLALACPEGYDPVALLFKKIHPKQHHNVKLVRDPKEAVKNADVINTDTWVSMGQEGKSEKEKKKIFEPYQVNASLLKSAKKEAIVLHCLPAHRGEEITDEVMDGPQSRVWDQAENRLHVQKALLEKLLA